jgi:secreted trypsin-like serine protease
MVRASMRSFLAALALVTLTVGCSRADGDDDASTAAINGGTLDTHDRAVVGLERDGAGVTFCTASVIAPTVLVTAAHCFPNDGAHTFRALLAADARSARPDDWVAVREVHSEPHYDRNEESGYDIAVVILEHPVSVTPLPFNATPLDANDVAQTARLVGYGLTGFNDDPATVRSTRHEVSAPVQNVNDKLVMIGDATHRVNSGDSGGPALLTIDGVERIVGITSFSSPQCEPGDCFTRVDRWASTFIASYLSPNGGPPPAPVCQYTCADYDYTPGQCQDGWYCDGACIENNGCQ